MSDRQINTVEALDALPEGSVVLDCQGDVWQRTDNAERPWELSGMESTSEGFVTHGYLPATVLHVPVSPSGDTAATSPNDDTAPCFPSLGESCGSCHRCDTAPTDEAIRAEVWDEAVQALAWAQEHGPDPLQYVAEHNPYRAEGAREQTAPTVSPDVEEG